MPALKRRCVGTTFYATLREMVGPLPTPEAADPLSTKRTVCVCSGVDGCYAPYNRSLCSSLVDPESGPSFSCGLRRLRALIAVIRMIAVATQKLS